MQVFTIKLQVQLRVGFVTHATETIGKFSEANTLLHTYPDSSITHYTGFSEIFLGGSVMWKFNRNKPERWGVGINAGGVLQKLEVPLTYSERAWFIFRLNSSISVCWVF